MNTDDHQPQDPPPAGGQEMPTAPPFSAFSSPVEELLAGGAMAAPSHPGVLGRLDHLEILRQIGWGGMGVVFVARDGRTGEEVAVKMLRPEFARDAGLTQRFLKEAENLRQLSHPNLLPVREVGGHEASPYFVMPFFPRGSLGSLLREGRPLAPDQALAIALELAEALRFIHSKWLFHRDVKPGNILIDGEGRVKVADFGLARPLFNELPARTPPNCPEGTAPYMSPLVAAGEAEDTRCDIYSFGAVLYEMLTGRPPYRGKDSREILEKIKAGPPEPLAQVNPQADPGLRAVAEKAMAREHCDRFANMADVLTALQRVQRGEDPMAPLPAPGAARRARAIRNFLIGSAVLLVLVGGVVLAHFAKPRLKVVQTIPNSEDAPYIDSGLTGDWNGDGRPDLLYTKDDKLQVILNSGSRPKPVKPLEPFNTRLVLSLVRDVNHDGLDEAFVSWANVTNGSNQTEVHLGALDRYGAAVKDYHVPGTVSRKPMFGVEISEPRALNIVDLEGDKRLELLVAIDSGRPIRPRGLCCFDLETAKLKWFFETAPFVSTVECVDVNGDGKLELLVGSNSPDNGHSITNGTDVTDDSHAYFYLLSVDGQCLWRKTLGDIYTTVSPVARPPAVTNRVYVTVRNPHHYDSSAGKPVVGSVMAFDAMGKLLHTYSPGAQIESTLAVDPEHSGAPAILAVDKHGELHVLNPDLSLRRKLTVVGQDGSSFLEPDLVGEVSLPGERTSYLAMTSHQVWIPENHVEEGKKRGNTPPVQFKAFQLLLLNSRFEVVAREVLPDQGTDGVQKPVKFLLLNQPGPPRFAVLAETIRFLEFSRW